MRENELYFLIKCNSLLRKKNRYPSFDRTDHITDVIREHQREIQEQARSWTWFRELTGYFIMLFSSFKAINDNRRSNLRCVLHHHSISYIPWALFRQLLLRLPGNQLYPVDVIKTNVNNNKNNLFKFVSFFPNQTDHLFIELQRRAFLVENNDFIRGMREKTAWWKYSCPLKQRLTLFCDGN